MTERISNQGIQATTVSHQEKTHPENPVGKSFGRSIQPPADEFEPRVLRASGLVRRPGKQLLRRRVAIRIPRPQVHPEIRKAHLKKKALRAEIMKLEAGNTPQVDQWVQKMKQGLVQVAADLQQEGIKEVTMDLKLDRLFQGYLFTSRDIDLLNKLKSLGRRDNLVAHLCGKISKDITTGTGLETAGRADLLARRNALAGVEAHAARQQFLTELEPSMNTTDPVEVMRGLIGRPFGLRQELDALQKKLGSHKLLFSTKGQKARSIRKAVKVFLESDQRRDLVAINRFVLAVRKQLDTMPGLQKQVGLANWPSDYARLMNPGK